MERRLPLSASLRQAIDADFCVGAGVEGTNFQVQVSRPSEAVARFGSLRREAGPDVALLWII